MAIAKNPTGYVVYEGPSMLDGMPIVVILVMRSPNVKTGNMAQLYILRKDVSPLDAVAEGLDSSICGNCKHRGDENNGRTCYVNVGQGPSSVWKAYKRGNYPRVSPAHRQLQASLIGRKVRLGAYGDPAAVPVILLRILLRGTAGHTGYTHQWRRFPELRDFVMASVDNPAEYAEATAEGWRTFRGSIDTEKLDREILCVNYTHDVQCNECGLCNGAQSGAKNIVIPLHGGAAIMSNIRKVAEQFA